MLATELLAAAIAGDAPAVKRLIDAQADPNEHGRTATPLMFAAQRGDTEMAYNLVQAKADLDAADANGTTALMMAARQVLR